MRERNFTPLYDEYGNRKYLTKEERNRFLTIARGARPNVMTFCLVLAYTGARISEVLSLTRGQIDFEAKCIIIRSAKKRVKVVFRAVPVPDEVLTSISRVHGFAKDDEGSLPRDNYLWNWGRTTAWARVTEIMKQSGLEGVGATPRGLRHAFGVSAIQSGIALNMVQKWLGHADMSTTSIYAQALGSEERAIARKLWDGYE